MCACFNVRSAARAITVLYDDAVAPCGLRIHQFAILASVRASGSLSMQALAGELGLDPSTMTRTLQPLLKEDLVRIEPGEDRRVRELVLTARGHRKFTEGAALWAGAQKGLRDKLGTELFDRMVGDLGAVNSALRE